MAPQPYLLHALSPLHAGTGHAADVIDLPIARMKATGIPIVPGSSVKGVLRDARKKAPQGDNQPDVHHSKWLAAFGPEAGNAADHAGALVVGDARLLALPVRSFKGTFAYVTSPLLLRLAQRDLGAPAAQWPIPGEEDFAPAARPENDQGAARPYYGALVASQNVFEVPPSDTARASKLYLQDLDLDAHVDDRTVGPWAGWLGAHVCGIDPGKDYLKKRFAIVDDETMTFLWDTATQLDQRVRIDEKTGTVAQGALWLEESLPAETLLIGLMEADRSRRKDVESMQPKDVLDFTFQKPADADDIVLQFGGKSTTGRGRCRLLPVSAAAT